MNSPQRAMIARSGIEKIRPKACLTDGLDAPDPRRISPARRLKTERRPKPDSAFPKEHMNSLFFHWPRLKSHWKYAVMYRLSIAATAWLDARGSATDN